jgi:hypothetical protein
VVVMTIAYGRFSITRARRVALEESWFLRFELRPELARPMGWFPWAPIDAWLERSVPDDRVVNARQVYPVSSRRAAVLLGTHVETVRRHRERGWITERQADRFAIALGLHPLILWPDFYDELAVPAA